MSSPLGRRKRVLAPSPHSECDRPSKRHTGKAVGDSPPSLLVDTPPLCGSVLSSATPVSILPSSALSSSSTDQSAASSSSTAIPVTPALQTSAIRRAELTRAHRAQQLRYASSQQPVPFFLNASEEESLGRRRHGRLGCFGARPDSFDASTVDCLPDNVLLYVLGFLTQPNDIRACFAVCRRWSQLLTSAWFSELHERYPRHLAFVVERNLSRQQCLLPCSRIALTSTEGPFFSHQTEITPSVRRILYDWFYEVCDEFRYGDETVFLAMHYVDSFLASASEVKLESLQLLGVAALWIATKLEEVEERPLDHFVRLCAGLHTRRQVVEMERVLLHFLNFDVLVFTRFHIMQMSLCRTLLLRARPAVDLAHYLCYLSVLDESMAFHAPSFIALVCSLLALAVYADQYPLRQHAHRLLDIFPVSHSPQAIVDVCRQLARFLGHFRQEMPTAFLRRTFATPRLSAVADLDIADDAIAALSDFLVDCRIATIAHSPLYSSIEHEVLSDSSIDDDELVD